MRAEGVRSMPHSRPASPRPFAQFARSRGTGSRFSTRFVVRLRLGGGDTRARPANVWSCRRRRCGRSRRGSSSSINGFVASSPSEASWCSMAASCLFTRCRPRGPPPVVLALPCMGSRSPSWFRLQTRDFTVGRGSPPESQCSSSHPCQDLLDRRARQIGRADALAAHTATLCGTRAATAAGACCTKLVQK